MSTLQEREAAARRRISEATGLENEHHPASSDWCSCGRREPCPVVLGCRQTRDEQSRELAQLRHLPHAETVVLPVIRAEDPPLGPARAEAVRPRRFGPLRGRGRGRRR